MNKLLVIFLSVFIVINLALYAEPSAFGAGDMDVENPYGLTSEEQLLLQNKKNLKKVTVKSNNQSNELDSLRDRIDGIQGIIESLGRNAHKNKKDLKNYILRNTDMMNNSNEFEKRLTKISQVNSILCQNNIDEIAKINLVVFELSTIINTINQNYVSKKEFNNLVNDLNKFKEIVVKELKSGSKGTASSSSKSSAEVAKEAQAYYDKKYYTKAIALYSYLIEKNYKPARANYMIGNMKYYRKNYEEAVAYYKTSAKLYSKASYMPILMLNSAISMTNLDDLKNAKMFFKSIIKKYPNTKHSKKAKDQLDLIK